MCDEGRLTNSYQGLPQKEESEDSAVPATVPLPAVSGAEESRAVAAGRPTGVVDTAVTPLRKPLVRAGRAGHS